MYAAISRSEPPIKLQRLNGGAKVSFAGPDSRLKDLYQSNPCRVLLPRRSNGRVEAVLLNTAGGITDGDRLHYAVSAENGAVVTATTQASEKVYRSRGGDSQVGCQLNVSGYGFLEWLPQETILFDGAAMARKTDIAIDEGSKLIALDWLVLGRLASGEHLTNAAVHDRWRVRRDGQLIWADDFRLRGNIEDLRQRPSLLDGARAMATLIYVAADAPGYLEPVRGLLKRTSCRAGVSMRPGLLICRFLSHEPMALRRDVENFLLAFRSALRNDACPLPRVWAC
jgi:urease accessory protein